MKKKNMPNEENKPSNRKANYAIAAGVLIIVGAIAENQLAFLGVGALCLIIGLSWINGK